MFKRALLVSPFFLIAIGLALKAIHSGHLLFGFMLSAYSITFFFLGIAVNLPFFQKIFMAHFGHLIPRIEGERAHFPAYSTAECLVAKQRYSEAMAKYRDIAEEFPEIVKPWLEMLTIALKFRKDATLAEAILAEARGHFPDPADQEILTRNHKALADYFLKPQTEPGQKLSLKGPPALPPPPATPPEAKTGLTALSETPHAPRKKISFRKSPDDSPRETLPLSEEKPQTSGGGPLPARTKLPFNPTKKKGTVNDEGATVAEAEKPVPAPRPELRRRKISLPSSRPRQE